MPYLLLSILFIIIFIFAFAISESIFTSTLVSGFISFALVIIFTFIFNIDNKREIPVLDDVYVNTYKLDALNDNFSTSGTINGSFFLGSGTVNGEFGPQMSYVFYYTKPDGQLIVNQYTPDEIDVYQKDIDEGYYFVKVRHIVREIDRPWRHWVFHNKRTESRKVIGRTLHIPKGTILKKLELDLK